MGASIYAFQWLSKDGRHACCFDCLFRIRLAMPFALETGMRRFDVRLEPMRGFTKTALTFLYRSFTPLVHLQVRLYVLPFLLNLVHELTETLSILDWRACRSCTALLNIYGAGCCRGLVALYPSSFSVTKVQVIVTGWSVVRVHRRRAGGNALNYLA